MPLQTQGLLKLLCDGLHRAERGALLLMAHALMEAYPRRAFHHMLKKLAIQIAVGQTHGRSVIGGERCTHLPDPSWCCEQEMLEAAASSRA
jgi:hypothetical protein